MCTTPNCKNKAWANKLCKKCYNARRRAQMPECSVEGCNDKQESRGLCRKHWMRKFRHGSTKFRGDRRHKRPCPVIGCKDFVAGASETCQFHNLTLTYSGAHTRIYRQRGKAADYACESCGLPAQCWSYNHEDPDELFEEEKGRYYSRDPQYYLHLCRSCHTVLDSQWYERTSDATASH